MLRYREAVKADMRRRMSPPHRQNVAQISAELGIHVVTVYSSRLRWTGFSGQAPSLTSEAGYRP